MFQKLDIRGHADPGVRAFNQIVAKQGLRRETLVQNGVEGGHIIDSLAVKDPFAKQILICVGDSLTIRVRAAGIGEDARETCCRRPCPAQRRS